MFYDKLEILNAIRASRLAANYEATLGLIKTRYVYFDAIIGKWQFALRSPPRGRHVHYLHEITVDDEIKMLDTILADIRRRNKT